MKRCLFGLSSLVLFLLAVLGARPALADVQLLGDWPTTDNPVGLDVDGVPRSIALKRLADAAGWSLVVADAPTDPVDLHLKNQPPRKVLSMLLAEGRYVATRDGDLVSIRKGEAASPPARAEQPALPAAPPKPPPPAARRGEDRNVTGGELRIGTDEVAHNVTVYGGSVDVLGTVTGDLSVLGGRARVAKDGHVQGNATVIGGSLRMDDGATVDGDVGVVGGSLDRADNATIGGAVTNSGGGTSNGGRHHHSSASPDREERSERVEQKGRLRTLIEDVGDATTRAALLFVFGAMVIALASKRVETLRVEVATRPMRSFALGVLGSIAALALAVALCVTVVGIPVAVVGVLLGTVAAYAGVAAVLTTAGEALLRHRTQNPYVHLAAGCALLLVVGSIPLIGGLVKAAVAFIGIGVLIATRGAGILPPTSRSQDAMSRP